MSRRFKTVLKNPLCRLLAASGLLQIFFSVLVYLLGEAQVFPSQIFPGGILFGDVQRQYVKRIAYLSNQLDAGNFHFLFSGNEQIHLRIYTISYAVLAPLYGQSNLSFELVNLPLFLLTIFLIYRIGEIHFDRKAGLLAPMLVVAALPSLSLHFTQPLRDPIFLAIFLAFFLLVLSVIKAPLNLSKAISLTVAVILTWVPMWFVRDAMLPVYLAVALVTLVLIGVKNSANLRRIKYNAATLLVLLAVMIIVPKEFSSLLPAKEILHSDEAERLKNSRSEQEQAAAPDDGAEESDNFQNEPDEGVSEFQAERVAYTDFLNRLKNLDAPAPLISLDIARHRFSAYEQASGSLIDSDVYFYSVTDLIRYLPRAALIGMYAPFPDMWFGAGASFGRTGRLIAGIETFFFYLLNLFAAWAVFKNLRSVLVWQTVFSVTAAIVGLGLVVINVGALYRERYVFWILTIILAAGGIRSLLSGETGRRRT